MQLTPSTKVMDLIKRYDFMLGYLAGYAPEFKKLQNPILRNTVGRFATLQMAASMASVPLERLLGDLRRAIEEQTGEEVAVEEQGALGMDPARLQLLKEIIADLHRGVELAQVKQRFAELVREVTPAEIAQMEQQLIAEGLPQEEVKRLCDVHVQVFKESLEQQSSTSPETPPGHPVHTFRAENSALGEVAQRLGALLDGLADGPDAEGALAEIARALETLAEIEKHYLRKENQLFPLLERRGVVGPTQVMWAIHDDVRGLLKDTRQALKAADVAALKRAGQQLVNTVVSMIYKEDNILLPMSLQVLEAGDWSEVRRGESEIGYALVTPGTEWSPERAEAAPSPEAARPGAVPAALPLDTGLLSLEQINLMLKHLPVDISLVDENDQVVYYSDSAERIFPRSPAVIGRKVQFCHPQKSVATVNRILEAFRRGEENVAEFWIQMMGRFVHIRYFALRDARGSYRGTLEVSQDVTAIRALEGQRRLLSWDEEKETRS